MEVAGPALFKQAQENVMEYVESCQFPKLLKSPEITLIENILQVEERSAIETEPSAPVATATEECDVE